MKKIAFFILSIFVLLLVTSHLSIRIGDFFYARKNYRKADVFYLLSYISSLSLNKNAKETYEEDSLQKETATSTKEYIISPSEIEISGKKVTQHKYGDGLGTTIALSAVIKNNAELGIPIVKIKKLTIYDKAHKIVATKTEFKDISPLVYGGEYPFSLILEFDNSENFLADSFDIELEIPSFTKNEKAVRLDVSDQKIISSEIVEVGYPLVVKSFQYKYRITIENNTDKEIDNIRRISFLKYNGFTLTRMADGCCYPVKFEIPLQNKDIVSLDKKQHSYTLKPHEEKEYEFQINSDPALFFNDINHKNIQMMIYFIGAVK